MNSPVFVYNTAHIYPIASFKIRFFIIAYNALEKYSYIKKYLKAKYDPFKKDTKCFMEPYHPETDGLSKRFNRTLKRMIICFANKYHNDWDEYLKILSLANNTSVLLTTKFTPFELIY